MADNHQNSAQSAFSFVGDILSISSVSSAVIAGGIATLISGQFTLDEFGRNLIMYGGATLLADDALHLLGLKKMESGDQMTYVIRGVAVGVVGVGLFGIAGLANLEISQSNLIAGGIMGTSAVLGEMVAGAL